MKCAIFEEHSSSCVVYSRFSGTLFPVSMIDGVIKTGVFSLVCNYLCPSNNSRQLIFNINAVVLALIIC